MRKTLKKIVTCAVALAMVLGVTAPVSAAQNTSTPYISSVTRYMDPESTTETVTLSIGGLEKGQVVKAKTVKSSKPGVASVTKFKKSSGSGSDEEYYYDSDENKFYTWENVSYNVDLKVKKPGTTKVSFKVDNKTYSSNLVVKKYVNPAKVVQITGVNAGKNIAGKTKTTNDVSLKLGKNVTAGKITVTAKKGWKVTAVSIQDTEIYLWRGMSCQPLDTMVLYTGDLKTTCGYNISVTYVNTTDGGSITCNYRLNQ